MPNVEIKPHSRRASRKSVSLSRWMITLFPLLISLLLWSVILLIGREMIRRLDREIATEAQAFFLQNREVPR